MGKNQQDDLSFIEGGAIAYINMGRLTGVYANDDVMTMIKRIRTAEAKIKSALAPHQPKRIIERNIPVFDEYDSPTAVHNGCACGSHYYPCETVKVLGGDGE